MTSRLSILKTKMILVFPALHFTLKGWKQVEEVRLAVKAPLITCREIYNRLAKVKF